MGYLKKPTINGSVCQFSLSLSLYRSCVPFGLQLTPTTTSPSFVSLCLENCQDECDEQMTLFKDVAGIVYMGKFSLVITFLCWRIDVRHSCVRLYHFRHSNIHPSNDL